MQRSRSSFQGAVIVIKNICAFFELLFQYKPSTRALLYLAYKTEEFI